MDRPQRTLARKPAMTGASRKLKGTNNDMGNEFTFSPRRQLVLRACKQILMRCCRHHCCGNCRQRSEARLRGTTAANGIPGRLQHKGKSEGRTRLRLNSGQAIAVKANHERGGAAVAPQRAPPKNTKEIPREYQENTIATPEHRASNRLADGLFLPIPWGPAPSSVHGLRRPQGNPPRAADAGRRFLLTLPQLTSRPS